MRPTIIGFLTATLYALVVATLISLSMPTEARLRASIEASRAISTSTHGVDARD